MTPRSIGPGKHVLPTCCFSLAVPWLAEYRTTEGKASGAHLVSTFTSSRNRLRPISTVCYGSILRTTHYNRDFVH